MLKYVSKFTLDILPSLVATVIGAYIVNHYIIPRPATNPPVAAAVSSAAPTVDVKPAETPPDAAAAETPPKGKAAAAVEKAAGEKNAPEKTAVEKTADKPADTASIPSENRRRPSAARERSAAKVAPTPAPTPAPVVAAPSTVVPPDNPSTADERRDANNLARAAIERLRGSSEPAAHAARGAEPARVASPPPSVQALPPAIMVSTPRIEPYNLPGPQKPIDVPVERSDDSHRPPAEIPGSRPIDLHAEAAAPSAPERTNVAEEMLTAAKSVFQAVLPR